MGKKKIMIVGAALTAVLIVVGICVAVFGSGQDTEERKEAEASSEALLAEESLADDGEEATEKKEKTKKKETKEEETETSEEEETQMEAKPMVQNSGISVGGTSAGDSFDIPMSDLYTFSDPSLSFDTRYVLYGGSGCTMAKKAGSQGYACLGAYEILYTSGGSAVAEYQCWVMGSEGDAIGWEAALSPYYNDSNCSTGRHGDVVYLYTEGSYIQKSYIEFYYKQGVIAEATAKAYLQMPFFFHGMSAYRGSGSKPSESPEPEPAPTPAPKPDPKPLPTPSGDDKETSKDIKISDSYTFKNPEGLDFDARYVLLCEDQSASAIKTVADASKADIRKAYTILYVKNGKPVAEYKCYATSGSGEAKKIADLYQQSDGLNGDVAVLYQDAAGLKEMLTILVQWAGMSAATPEAYLQYLMQQEGFQEYKGEGSSTPVPKPTPDPTPGPEPTPDPTPGPSPAPGPSEEVFVPDFTKMPMVQITKDYSFTDPEGLDFAVRFGAYGGKDSLFAAQYQAEGFCDVIYADGAGKAAAEYRFYVMENEGAARTLQEKFAGQNAEQNGRVVLVSMSGAEAQDFITTWVPGASSVRQYFETVKGVYGLTVTEASRTPDFTAKGNVWITGSCTFADPGDLEYDTRYAAYGGKDSLFVQTAMDQAVEGLCEILYSKEGTQVGWYKLYIMADEAAAKAKKAAMASAGTDVSLSAGNVVCASYTSQEFQAYIGNFGKTTLEEYLAFMSAPPMAGLGLDYTAVTYEGKPAPEPENPIGTDKGSSPAFQLSNSYVFENPADLDFDSRYAFVCEDKSASVIAVMSQVGAKINKVYDVLYVKDGKAVAEYTCYITESEADAETLRNLSMSGQGNVAIRETDVAGLEGTMNILVQYGQLSEATPEAYLQYQMSTGLKPFRPTEAAVSEETIQAVAENQAEPVEDEIQTESVQAVEKEAQSEPVSSETQPLDEKLEASPKVPEASPKVPEAALPETAEDVLKKTEETKDSGLEETGDGGLEETEAGKSEETGGETESGEAVTEVVSTGDDEMEAEG